MLVSVITERVAEILQDVDNVTWEEAQLIGWFNDAVRALITVRPDASSLIESIQLAAGTKQELTDAADLRLIKITRNMGDDGTTVGRAIRLTDMKAMDDYYPEWHEATAKLVVKEYMFDEATPKIFWVYPPVSGAAAVYVEAIKAVLPTEVAATTDDVPVDGNYAPALIEWMCYRAFSRDAEETPNWARAGRHFTAFFNVLQVKMQADMAINPRIRERVQA